MFVFRKGYDMEGLEVYAMAETSIYMTDSYSPVDVLLPVIIEMPLPEDLTDVRHGQQLEAWYFNAESGTNQPRPFNPLRLVCYLAR